MKNRCILHGHVFVMKCSGMRVHIQGLDAPFLYKLLFHILGEGEYNSPKMSKGSVSFSTHIADMRPPL